MKVLAIALGVFLLVRGALASLRAGPYNFVYYFSIYRAEIELYGVGKTYTATGCQGSLADGSCTFDDFCRHVKHPNKPWTGTTNIGNNLAPNPHAAAEQLRLTNHPNNFDNDKLLPDYFRKGQNPNFASFMGAGLDTLKEIKKGATAAQMASIDRYLVNVVDAFDSIWEERIADIHEKMVDKLKDAVKPTTLTVKTDRTPLPSGGSFDKINLVDTLAANPGLNSQMRQAVTDIHADQTSNPNDPHVKGLNALQNMATDLYGTCGLMGGGNPGVSRI